MRCTNGMQRMFIVIPAGFQVAPMKLMTSPLKHLHALADGMDSKAMLGRDLVTSPAIYRFDDQSVDEAAKLMHDNQIRRLVVLSRDKRMVGVVSLGDLAMNTDDKLSGEVLQSVSEPMSASRPEPG